MKPMPPPPLPNSDSVQTTDFVWEDSLDVEPFVVVEQMPEFPGGMTELGKYLQENLRIPDDCKDGGRILYSFVVDETGKLIDIEVTKSSCSSLKNEEEMKKIIEKMPRWKPGRQDGKAVDVRYSLPMHIHLEKVD